MRPTWKCAVAVALAAVHIAGGAQVESSKKQPAKPKFYYWHNWTDMNGVSHLAHCSVSSFELRSIEPPADAQWQAQQPESKSQVVFTEQPIGWKGSWHEEPKVQWMVPLQGRVFVQAMDGKRVELGPGEVLLAEDQNTKSDAQGHKGHLDGNVGSGAVRLLLIQSSEQPTINQPCRFK